MNIQNAIAVVTGAGSGIGRALSVELARRGAKMLALVDLSDRVVETAQCVSKVGDVVVQTFTGDTTDPEFRHSVFEAVYSQYGAPNICVPAAGITRDALAVR